MTVNQIYRCPICGNIVEILHVGGGELVCCGQPMELLEAKNQDLGFEKHVPIIEKTDTGITVRVGSILHPMEETHYIEFIELITNNKVYKKFLKPGEEPVANFEIKSDNVKAVIYCNVHGLWQSEDK